MDYRRVERIGDATLYLGDCLGMSAAFEEADTLIMDPPYSSGGFNESGKAAGSVGSSAPNRFIQGDTMSTGGYRAMIREVVRIADVLQVYSFTDWRMWGFTAEAIEMAGHRRRGMLVWDKTVPGMGMKWRLQHELVCWGTRIASRNGPALGTVLTHKRVNSSKKLHPTEKPVSLMSEIVLNSGGEVIADPFMGAGTTGVACVLAGKGFVGMELDERFFDAACERIAAAHAEWSSNTEGIDHEDV